MRRHCFATNYSCKNLLFDRNIFGYCFDNTKKSNGVEMWNFFSLFGQKGELWRYNFGLFENFDGYFLHLTTFLLKKKENYIINQNNKTEINWVKSLWQLSLAAALLVTLSQNILNCIFSLHCSHNRWSSPSHYRLNIVALTLAWPPKCLSEWIINTISTW